MRLRARFALFACLAASFATLAVGVPRAGASFGGPTQATDPALTDACGVASGTLRLSAHQTAGAIICRSPFGDFRTDLVASTVSTRGRFSQAYGRFASRARMPKLQVAGAHSATWVWR